MWRAIGILSLLTIAGCGAYVDHRASQREADALKRWPPIGQFVDVDGVQVHYVQKGSGPDLVLLHGAGGNLRDFTFALMDRLTGDFRVTAFDRPGLGYTDRLPESRGAFNTMAETPQAQTALLASAAEQIGIRTPIVLGQSFGGSLAMAWGLDHGAAAVVSVSGAIMPWPGGLDLQYRVVGSRLGGAVVPPLATAFINPDNTDEVLASIFAPQSPPDGYGTYVGPGLTLRRTTLRANGKQVHALKENLRALSARYAGLEIPVELLHGDTDEIVSLEIHAQAAAQILPNAQLTVLPGIGHMPQHTNPDDIVAAIHRAAKKAGLR